MFVNDYFDKIFCINLKRREDRWKTCLAEFKKHNLEVEQFEAVEGKKISPLNNWMSGPRVACCKSHANVLKKMLDNNWKKILILEDDVEFIENFQTVFCERMELVPKDYDMLYLCGNNPQNTKMINNYVFKITSVLSTGAYSITANFAKHIIPKIEEFKDPVDCVYSANTPTYNCYIFRPYLSKQRADFSDIEGRFTDYSVVINSDYVDKPV